ncbi:fumarate hydratase FumD [Pseudenterobacter timonensis]|uniref:Fumarase D n=1 Tax=Pseudenterobacter timonensis TaxID=1755099 RepID=A0AAE4DLZ4_9ENTR|nr:fumarate hydratase FumD [Pseudenterobacter timonensis]MDR9889951.1 fumarate hydratase FumD [Pseudenterobacter timonensis]
MGNVTKDEALYQEMCRVVGKVVLEMRDLGQEPKHIVIAGVLRTALANSRIQRSELTTQAMETVVKALSGVPVSASREG